MKKTIALLLSLLCFFLLSACAEDKKISFPPAENISQIEITESDGKSLKRITQADKISALVEDMKENTKDSGRESVNDQPTNIETYYILEFHLSKGADSTKKFHLYKDKDTCYIEEPYTGIWTLKNKIYDALCH